MSYALHHVLFFMFIREQRHIKLWYKNVKKNKVKREKKIIPYFLELKTS